MVKEKKKDFSIIIYAIFDVISISFYKACRVNVRLFRVFFLLKLQSVKTCEVLKSYKICISKGKTNHFLDGVFFLILFCFLRNIIGSKNHLKQFLKRKSKNWFALKLSNWLMFHFVNIKCILWIYQVIFYF